MKNIRLFFFVTSFLLAESPEPALSKMNSKQDSTGTVVSGTVSASAPAEPLVGVNIIVTGTHYGAASDKNGKFTIKNIPPGSYEIRASMIGYDPHVKKITLRERESVNLDIQLNPTPVDLPGVEVIGSNPAVYQKIPGSGEVLGAAALRKTSIVGVSVLRKVSGVHVKDEEGFGLRPSIGIRGLYPTRSTKVLLLEDGVPFVQSPYGDPATYYHPPISRFERIEVLKGSGQVLFGPQTVGGVINYITPRPPEVPAGSLKIMAGNRNYLFGEVGYGAQYNTLGFLTHYSHTQGNLALDNTSTNIHDIVGKVALTLDGNSRLTVKGNYYNEVSNATYTQLTQIEFEENPHGNPFIHDTLFSNRVATQITYDHHFGNSGAALSTNVYGYNFNRDWWRQGNNGGVNATAPVDTPGTRTVLNPDRVDGKNRKYWVWGVEPRMRFNHHAFGYLHQTDFGVRAHYEIQDRKQILGNSPTARTGIAVEDNDRRTQAYSGFFQDRLFVRQDWTVSAGVRVENVHHQRLNRLRSDASGATTITEWIPGIGTTYNPAESLTFYAGAHRGWAPPRVEDVISDVNGATTELEPEKSWNFELGARSTIVEGLDFHATVFKMDFENQIIPYSAAGGSGSTFTNSGKCVHEGFEMSGSADMRHLVHPDFNFLFDVAFTYLPVARFDDNWTSGFDRKTNVKGNRVTYAPRQTATVGISYLASDRFSARLEGVHVGEQFSDDLNTVTPTPSGRQGLIPASTYWNFDASYSIKPWNLTAILSVKNLFDNLYIVDRSRGILAGNSRLVHAGMQWEF
jgi:Fe(3+) dicitrate transport protein